jgi:nicotinamide mononucleotide transporter
MTNVTETVAAALAVAYLLLAIRQWRSCWIAAFTSSCLYVVVLFRAHLYMESLLNVFYAAMAVYGYLAWRGALAGIVAARVHRWPLRRHLQALLVVVLLAALNSYALRAWTAAASPFADSFVTWASVFATFLVARKVFENWHWWLVIDSLTLWLSWSRGLRTTAALFGLYLVMIGFGMRAWRRDLGPQHAGS